MRHSVFFFPLLPKLAVPAQKSHPCTSEVKNEERKEDLWVAFHFYHLLLGKFKYIKKKKQTKMCGRKPM